MKTRYINNSTDEAPMVVPKNIISAVLLYKAGSDACFDILVIRYAFEQSTPMSAARKRATQNLRLSICLKTQRLRFEMCLKMLFRFMVTPL